MTVSKFYLPDVGEGLTEAEIVSWKVKPGDSVAINDVLVEIETAKSLVELPSPYAGQVSELLAGLEMISFEELAETAGDLRELRRLLVTSLQRTVSACSQELSIVQGRLLELLGRFRQIRRHLKHIHHHLVGDTSHGDGRHNLAFRMRGVHRMLLHAWRLEFPHPADGTRREVTAVPDPEFSRALALLGLPSP